MLSQELRIQNPNLVKAMSWVAENKHRYKRNIYDPMIFEVILFTFTCTFVY